MMPTDTKTPHLSSQRIGNLWFAAAVAASLLTHALFNLNVFLIAALLNCIAFATFNLISLDYDRRVPQFAKLSSTIGIVAIAFVAWHYKTLFGKEAGLSSLSLLVTFKLWELQKSRDIHILSGLLFFLVLGALLREESALLFIGSLISIIFTLSAWVFYTASQNSNAQTLIRWNIPLKETLKLALLGLPLAVVLFFVFPRIAGPLWGLPEDATGGRTGLSSTLEPGRFAQLALNEELAFSVKFKSVAPSPNQLYWRGPVLTDFDARIWTAPSDVTLSNINSDVTSFEGKNTYEYTIVTEPHKKTHRVLLDAPYFASHSVKISNTTSPYGDLLLERETVQARSIVPGQESHSIAIPHQGQFALRTVRNERLLPIDSNPKTVQLAQNIKQTMMDTSGDPRPYIQAVLQLYQNSFRYTLEPQKPVGRTEDSIDGFLFQTQAGYCEHFASSFVFLMRAMGFPARIVLGYQGGELNPKDGWITVRQSDAHAWAEVFHPGKGWLRVDPTTAVAPWRVEAGGSSVLTSVSNLPAGISKLTRAASQALLPLKHWAQAGSRLWQDFALNYGKDKQKKLFNTFGFDDVDGAAVATILVACISVWSLFLLWIHQSKRLKRNSHQQVLEKFDAFCRRLKYPRSPAISPRRWLHVYEEQLDPKLASNAKSWVTAYEQLFFADNPLSSSKLPKL